MKAINSRTHRLAGVLTLFWILLVVVLPVEARQYKGHEFQNNQLTLETDDGVIRLSFVNDQSLEVVFEQVGMKPESSYSIAHRNTPEGIKLKEKSKLLRFSTPALTAEIQKSPLQIRYYRGNNLLLSEADGFFLNSDARGVRFQLQPGEKLLGGGERSLAMDRRGYRLPLYNAPHGEYTTHSEQMNYSLPAVLSSDKYLLLFDNPAKGWMDIGKTEPDILSFEAVGGRLAYLVVAGNTYPDIVANYVDVTGKQPMPPRWALGYIASRFGYHTEQEARDTLAKFAEEKLPVDAIIFDLFWFGKDIKGHMGNLEWDREAFPQPEKMMADFAAQGIKTVLITEPFILTGSKKWADAVAHKALATDGKGNPFTFPEFYFGETGIVDIFDAKAQQWFWGIYNGLMQEGAAGWWCDLAEPEMHPAGAMHVAGSADEVHNAYGHEWARMIYENQIADFPGKRPFILIRSGFAGSQRFGIFPWTGDVKRAWGGLKPQVAQTLQMGLMGLAYTHSDLGGFAGDRLDTDLYIRWLQYGVFQPIYRPHGIEPIAPEPVFHEDRVKEILRPWIELRYRLMPYNYTLAHINSTTGMPLMRPLFFSDESNPALMDDARTYFWGDAFLVSPITDPAVGQVRLDLPKGAWFDFWSEQRYEGGRQHTLDMDLKHIPVLVKAGAFVPMVDAVVNAASYSSRHLTLHYYHDASVSAASGQMYEDDGETFEAYENGMYELLDFSAASGKSGLKIHLQRTAGAAGYSGMPESRRVRLVVHNADLPGELKLGDLEVSMVTDAAALDSGAAAAFYDANTRLLTLAFDWDHQPLQLTLGK